MKYPKSEFRNWVLALLLATVGGCTSEMPKLTLTSQAKPKVFSQSFPHAYLNRSDSGDYDIVLVDDGSKQDEQSKPGAPLLPSPGTPLRQIVHLHIFWKPMKGLNPDDPAAGNAAMHWYIVHTDKDNRQGILRYDGVGFISVFSKGTFTRVELRSGALKATRLDPPFSDPLGPVTIQGTFRAKNNRAKVEELLAELQAMTIPTDPANSAASSPPPRGNTGP